MQRTGGVGRKKGREVGEMGWEKAVGHETPRPSRRVPPAQNPPVPLAAGSACLPCGRQRTNQGNEIDGRPSKSPARAVASVLRFSRACLSLHLTFSIVICIVVYANAIEREKRVTDGFFPLRK
jgi:hypothetical protein